MAKAKTKTVVGLVLDETGSMFGIADDTRGSVNQYFEELGKDSPDSLVSVSEFSDIGGEPKFRSLCSGVKVSEVPKLTEANYRPRGSTPLYDSIGQAINDLEKVNADKFLLVVMTDGLENSSTEWTLENIKKKIEDKRATDNWTIVYLGANQDAWAVGTAMGVSAGSTMTYASTSRGVAATMDSLSTATSSLLSSSKSRTETFFEDAGQTAEDYDDKK